MTPSASGRNILILHTDSHLATTLTAILRQNGHAVKLQAEPPLGARRIRALKPDLVITSDSYTASTGEPLAAWLRRVVKVPIIAVCNAGDVLAGVRMLEMGADDCLTSACGSREALARVNRLLRSKGS